MSLLDFDGIYLIEYLLRDATDAGTNPDVIISGHVPLLAGRKEKNMAIFRPK